MKTLPIEREIIRYLKLYFNKKIKLENLVEWSTSEEVIDKNLLDGETKVKCCGIWCAVNIAKTENLYGNIFNVS